MTIVRPDLVRWSRVRVGMTKAEVQALLGEPHSELEGVRMETDGDSWLYGYVTVPGLAFSTPYVFHVSFAEGRVKSVESCIDRESAIGPEPGVPNILVPGAGHLFTHYPRIIDVRWTPVPGDLPMSFQLEYATGFRGEWGESVPISVEEAHVAICLPGAGMARVRVRGVNAHGAGPWSRWRVFELDL